MESEARKWSIHIIPDDVWRLIFGETALGVGNELSTVNTIKTAITISHVCNLFRWVAINQTELWNRVSVTVIVADDRAFFPHGQLVILALKRARQLPLVVDLRVEARSVHTQIAHRTASTWGLPFVQRLSHAGGTMGRTETSVCERYLVLIHTLCALCSPFYQTLYSYFPQLESLGQIMSEISKRPIKKNHLTINRQEGMVLSWSRFEFRSERLLYLEIGGPVVFQTLVGILSAANSLIKCILRKIWDYEALEDDDVTSVNSINLPSLTEFRIQGSRPMSHGSASKILSLIAAPSLEAFFVTEWDWYHSDMITFVRKIPSKLRTLSLAGVSITSPELIEFLGFLPNLETLSFDLFFNMDDNTFFAHKMMACDSTHTTFQLCRSLVSMRILSSYIPDHYEPPEPPNARTSSIVQCTPISNMVERRLRGVKPGPRPSLRDVHIFSAKGRTSSAVGEITRLLALQKEGLHVKFGLGCQGSFPRA